MTYTIRKAKDRGFFDHGWLKTYHTFSFGNYYDSNFMGFRSLRVINEDQVMPDSGFPSHSHKNMEIITYVIEGELAHKDSLGTESILRQNELQLMHAGSGITHSEYNPSHKNPVHFLQIWLIPDVQDVEPGYSQVSANLTNDVWTLVAAKEKGLLRIYQDSEVSLAPVTAGKSLALNVERYGHLQVVSGSFMLDDVRLDHGDGVAFTAAGAYALKAASPGKLLFFSLS